MFVALTVVVLPLQAQTFNFDFQNDLVEPRLVGDGSANFGVMGHHCGRFGNINCGSPHFGGIELDGTATDPAHNTDWVQEMVIIDGVRYWHTIVGDPLEGFAQDVYIREGSVQPDFTGTNFSAFSMLRSLGINPPDGGGFAGHARTNAIQAGNCWYGIGYACNPLGHNPAVHANGFQNPTHVAMKQVMFDSEIALEFEKSNLSGKPVVTQAISNDEITLEFKADMSAGNYSEFGQPLAISSDVNDPNVFVNRLTHADGNPPAPPGQNSLPGPSSFDHAKYAHTSALTAGQYIFTPGLGWSDSRPNVKYKDVVDFAALGYTPAGFGDYRIYDKGAYSYISGAGVLLDEINWKNFMSLAQNPCRGGPWCGEIEGFGWPPAGTEMPPPK